METMHPAHRGQPFVAIHMASRSVRRDPAAVSEVGDKYTRDSFANLGDLGIMLGGLATMLPQRRRGIIDLCPCTLVAETLATLCCGCVVGTMV